MSANQQLTEVFSRRAEGDLRNIVTTLNESLVDEFGGWESAGLPNTRRPKNPEAFYAQFPAEKRTDLRTLLTAPQFQVDSEWYCLETARSPEEDLWDISLPDLAEYINYRVNFEKDQQACEACKACEDLCPAHEENPRPAQSGKTEDHELMTHADWCCAVMMVIRGLIVAGRLVLPDELARRQARDY